MSEALIRIPLAEKEGEALMWGLAQIGDYLNRRPNQPNDPLFILLNEGWSRKAIGEACERLFEVAYGDWLSEPWTDLERSILRCCIENTTWIETYRTHQPTAGNSAEITRALETLRSLATKLDAFGIEIAHIPFA